MGDTDITLGIYNVGETLPTLNTSDTAKLPYLANVTNSDSYSLALALRAHYSNMLPILVYRKKEGSPEFGHIYPNHLWQYLTSLYSLSSERSPMHREETSGDSTNSTRMRQLDKLLSELMMGAKYNHDVSSAPYVKQGETNAADQSGLPDKKRGSQKAASSPQFFTTDISGAHTPKSRRMKGDPKWTESEWKAMIYRFCFLKLTNPKVIMGMQYYRDNYFSKNERAPSKASLSNWLNKYCTSFALKNFEAKDIALLGEIVEQQCNSVITKKLDRIIAGDQSASSAVFNALEVELMHSALFSFGLVTLCEKIVFNKEFLTYFLAQKQSQATNTPSPLEPNASSSASSSTKRRYNNDHNDQRTKKARTNLKTSSPPSLFKPPRPKSTLSQAYYPPQIKPRG